MSHLIVTFGGGSRFGGSGVLGGAAATTPASASFSRSSNAAMAWFRMPIASLTALTGYSTPLISFNSSAVDTALLNDDCIPLSNERNGMVRSAQARNAMCDSKGEVSLRLNCNDFNSWST